MTHVNTKEALFSNRGMRIVNILFFLSVFIRGHGIIFIAYLLWIAYLAYGIKNASSKPVKIMYSMFMVFASVMIAVNICVMLHLI